MRKKSTKIDEEVIDGTHSTESSHSGVNSHVLVGSEIETPHNTRLGYASEPSTTSKSASHIPVILPPVVQTPKTPNPFLAVHVDNIQEIAQGILTRLREHFCYSSASVQLVRGGERDQVATYPARGGKTRKQELTPIHRDKLISDVVSQRFPLILTYTDEYEGWSLPKVKSWVGLPIFHKDALVAIITL